MLDGSETRDKRHLQVYRAQFGAYLDEIFAETAS